jgi:hypothetical protein
MCEEIDDIFQQRLNQDANRMFEEIRDMYRNPIQYAIISMFKRGPLNNNFYVL